MVSIKMNLFICQFPGCLKQYKNKCNLKRHEEAFHSDNKKFQCEYCTKVLSSRQNLKEHEFIHTNEMPYLCKEFGCGLRFRHGSQYSAHKRIHIAIKNIVDSPLVGSFNVPFIKEGLNKENTNERHVEIKLPLIVGGQDYFLPII
ncbi:hypothetical protein SteCoe_13652 [Stentor coeruleus]|uniref:C2H2-type domain-containing protein n=1 Tax=Stentor coeruleus TaxID=5963 RepID=A0A1R2C808_9CILI|nr:hypothetical protein SteCoe_13652 [Stentor coeruleus]